MADGIRAEQATPLEREHRAHEALTATLPAKNSLWKPWAMDLAEDVNALMKPLDRIAWILATPEWSVGMLEDIAAIVNAAGFKKDPHDEYIHH